MVWVYVCEGWVGRGVRDVRVGGGGRVGVPTPFDIVVHLFNTYPRRRVMVAHHPVVRQWSCRCRTFALSPRLVVATVVPNPPTRVRRSQLWWRLPPHPSPRTHTLTYAPVPPNPPIPPSPTLPPVHTQTCPHHTHTPSHPFHTTPPSPHTPAHAHTHCGSRWYGLPVGWLSVCRRVFTPAVHTPPPAHTHAPFHPVLHPHPTHTHTHTHTHHPHPSHPPVTTTRHGGEWRRFCRTWARHPMTGCVCVCVCMCVRVGWGGA